MEQNDRQQPVVDRHASMPVTDGMGLLSLCERLPKSVLAVGSVLLVMLVTYLDFVTGNEFSLLIFYLFPIGFAAWYGTRGLGLFVAVLSAIGWVIGDLFESTLDHPLLFIWNASMRISVFLVLAHLLSSLRARLVEGSIQARTDPLTGLFNRRHLYERIEGELQRARRHDRPLTLISIDVDDFKTINDHYGHAAGDAVLCAISDVLRHSTREIDVAARTGGDEFVILMIETDATAAHEVAVKLQGALRRRIDESGRSITFSFGVVTFEQPPATVDEMFRLVDAQLYSAKRFGKDRVAQTVAQSMESSSSD
jgi:diguanylate cyclase (GGDEF)-like protein